MSAPDDESRAPRDLTALARARPASSEGEQRALRLNRLLGAVLGVTRDEVVIGDYLLEERVGGGGMGVVYRGRHRESGERVAVKLLSPEARDERARFEREALALHAIRHPRVVRYLDHGVTEEGTPYLAMEWLEGCDLSRRLSSGPLGQREVLMLGIAAAEGLAAAHEAGLVHRDVKPGNLFLVGEQLEEVRLIDFGIARGGVHATSTRLTATGSVLGSPHYMAPEQLRGEHDVRTDVYGLGATLFESLTGHAPFAGVDAGAVLVAVVAEPAPAPSRSTPGISPAVDALVLRMLAKDPRDRPRDMPAVIALIADLLRDEASLSESAPLSRLERRPPRRRAPLPGEVPLMGRSRQLGAIDGLLEEALEEDAARLIVVSGEAGLGKSRLLDAVAARARSGPWRVLTGRASRADVGVPWAALATLRGPGSEALEALLGAGFEAAADPLIASDRLRLGWLQALENWSESSPLLIVLDSAEDADLVSMSYLERALEHLRERAFALLIGTRTSLGLGSRAVDRLAIELPPLGPRASRLLAESWTGGAASGPGLDETVKLAGGSPGVLAELCADLREGRKPEPGSRAHRIASRLSGESPEARRLLRACAIAGDVWPSALGAMLGVEVEALAHHLDHLRSRGFLVPVEPSRLPAEPQLALSSELLQLAAYELNTDEDLVNGHRAIARWLAERRIGTPAELGRHLLAAGERKEALPHLLASARSALIGADATLLERQIQAAESCAPSGESLGELFLLRAIGAFWRGALDQAYDASRAGLAALRTGSPRWYDLASLAITACGQRGDNEAVAALARAVLATSEPDDPEAHWTAVCRAASQLEAAGHPDAPALFELLDGLEAARCGPMLRAWLCRVRAFRVADVDPAGLLALLIESHRAYLEASDRRSAAHMGIFIAQAYTRLGAWERAQDTIEEALGVARRLGAGYLELWARYSRGKLLVEDGDWPTARAELERVAADAKDSPRIRDGALIYASMGALRAGLPESAQAYVQRILQGGRSSLAPLVELGARATMARALVALGDPEAARPHAELIMRAFESGTRLHDFEDHLRLGELVTWEALGETVRRDAALARALSSIETRARGIPTEERKSEFLSRPHLVSALRSRRP